MKYTENLDHHSENYIGIEGCYNGMDANDYAFEKALEKLEKSRICNTL